MDTNSLPQDNNPKFGPDKMAMAGGRPLPPADTSVNDNDDDDLSFGQAKLEATGGRNLPKQQQGASTLEVNDIGNVDKLGAFPN